MARFNISKYSPQQDSSPGAKATTHVILKVEDGACLCGCGQVPLGEKSRFMMGHDARFKGILIRAHLTGTKVSINGKTSLPITIAGSLGWDHYLVDAETRQSERDDAKTSKPKTVKIKVGRGTFNATVVRKQGDKLVVEYTTKSGDVKRRTVAA